MYLPVAVNINIDIKEAQLLKNSLVENEYYYVIEKQKVHVDPAIKNLDEYQSIRTLARLGQCDLTIIGKNRGQNMPPYFGLKFIMNGAFLIEYISYLYDKTSIINDISMLVEYLSVKNKDIKYLVIPYDLGFISDAHKVVLDNDNIVIEIS